MKNNFIILDDEQLLPDNQRVLMRNAELLKSNTSASSRVKRTWNAAISMSCAGSLAEPKGTLPV